MTAQLLQSAHKLSEVQHVCTHTHRADVLHKGDAILKITTASVHIHLWQQLLSLFAGGFKKLSYESVKMFSLVGIDVRNLAMFLLCCREEQKCIQILNLLHIAERSDVYFQQWTSPHPSDIKPR